MSKYEGLLGALDSINDINELTDDQYNLDFGSQPILMSAASSTSQVVDGTAGDPAIHQYPEMQLILYPIGTQSIFRPADDTNGLNYSYDDTDNEGIEFVTMLNGTKGVEGKTKFTVGNAAYYAKLKFSIEDVSGTDDCAFGFCKNEAHAAALDDKDEMACLNVISGVINIETILNGGATTTTDTTLPDWADGETHELEVRVDIAGAVTYKVDGATPTVVAAFSFDIGEVIMPFFFYINSSETSGAMIMQNLEFGLQ